MGLGDSLAGVLMKLLRMVAPKNAQELAHWDQETQGDCGIGHSMMETWETLGDNGLNSSSSPTTYTLCVCDTRPITLPL